MIEPRMQARERVGREWKELPESAQIEESKGLLEGGNKSRRATHCVGLAEDWKERKKEKG